MDTYVGKEALIAQKLIPLSPAARQEVQLELAKQEAELIGDLTGRRKLRVHVVGDCPSPQSATLVGTAMVKHEQKRGKPAWTYTHAWKAVPIAAWCGARVLASCHRISEVAKAMMRGYAVALTILPVTSNKAYQVHKDERGRTVAPFTIVPCPAQFKQPNGRRYSTCETCSLCQNTDRLKRDRLVIGFQPDYQTDKKLIPLIRGKP